ncbi:hypothetical protein [Phnomibacter sp. MR]|uniref:hypothetical protein n=1 Tax=Phnomibacter sp. MR TaxID=3042318 RepID=UPI003A7F8754
MRKIVCTFFTTTCCLSLFAQNVGIGIANPTYPLTVAAPSGGRGIIQKTDAVELGFWTSNSAAFLQTWSNHPLQFATNNSTAQMVLSTSGTLGIGSGVIDNTVLLHVHGKGRVLQLGINSSFDQGDFLTRLKVTNGDAVFSSANVMLQNGSRLGIGVENFDLGYPLTVHGTTPGFRYRDGNQAAGKVLTSDAGGIASWQNIPAPVTKTMGVNLQNNQTAPSGTITAINFDLAGSFVNGFPGAFNASNKTFTVPAGQDGVYMISAQVQWYLNNAFTGSRLFNLYLNRNGNAVAGSANYYAFTAVGETYTANFTRVLSLSAGDVLLCNANQFSGVSHTLLGGSGFSFMSITRLY